MTIEEILKLGEMGYTKADIEKMSATEPKPEPNPEPKADDYYSKISAQMTKLLSAIQKANIGNDNQPKPITAEEALAAIINPPEVKK